MLSKKPYLIAYLVRSHICHIFILSDDVIFVLSMITSFGALVYFGIKFNERETNGWTKWLLSFPMFAASVASRAFTLAVFLKETTIGIHLENANSG